MKKVYLTLCLALGTLTSTYAQWTGTGSSSTVTTTNTEANVGIGTASPADKLVVQSSGTNHLSLIRPNANVDNLLNFFTGSTINFWLGTPAFDQTAFGLYSNSSLGNGWLIRSQVNSRHLWLQPNGGNVGINAVNPSGGTLEIDAQDNDVLSALALRQGNAPQFGLDLAVDQGVDGRAFLYGVANNVRTSLIEFNRSSNIVSFDRNIGIGTDNPGDLVQVAGGVSKFNIGPALMAYGTSYIGFNAARNGGNWVSNGDGTHNGGGVVFADVFGNINFATLGSTGTDSQTLTDAQVTSKINFQVTPAGIAHAKQVVVETDPAKWPDYVFRASYHLRPLSEVKAYIERNGHLPEVPSQEQVAREGQNLGEMNKLLLKKIEELTLYMMRQDKRIKELENQAQKKSL